MTDKAIPQSDSEQFREKPISDQGAASYDGSSDIYGTLTLLSRQLSDQDSEKRRAAAASLVKIGESSTGVLVGALRYRNEHSRGLAAWALGEIGASRAIEPLNGMLSDQSSFVREQAQIAVSKISRSYYVQPFDPQGKKDLRQLVDRLFSVKFPVSEYANWSFLPGVLCLPFVWMISILLSISMSQTGEDLNFYIFINNAVLFTTLIVVVLVHAVLMNGAWTSELGFSLRRFPQNVLLGIVLGLVSFRVITVILELTYIVFGDMEWVEGPLDLIKTGGASFASSPDPNIGIYIALFFFFAVIVAPVAEEVFFRSYLYPSMRKRMNFASAAILNGAVFSLAHISIMAYFSRMVFGAGMAALYEKTGSIYPCIIAHGVSNAIVFFLMFGWYFL